MSKVIHKATLYAAVWFVATTGLVSPWTNLSVMLQSQAERSTRNSHKTKPVVYTNKKYRFRLSLPESWRGYSIVVSEWEGGDGRTYQRGEVMPPPEKGPFISIVHPLSTEAEPRADIQIMIFTHAQWDLIEDGKLIVSAAPVGPSEMGRNAKYIFALPPRFNYALLPGWEEVDEIIQHHPLHPF
jgi:hypothetical protein